MTASQKGSIQSAVAIVSLLAMFGGICVGFTNTSRTADQALKIANESRATVEQLSREHAFFKGEVNAKLENLIKNSDRTLEFISNLEPVYEGKEKQKD